MKADSLIFLLLVASVGALVWVMFKREKRPDPYKDIASRPVIPAVVIDFDMPFGSMVILLLKPALASLPALFLLILVLVFFLALLGLPLTAALP